jgi:hypothetical protein
MMNNELRLLIEFAQAMQNPLAASFHLRQSHISSYESKHKIISPTLASPPSSSIHLSTLVSLSQFY